MLLKLGARLRAGLSALLTKLGSVSVNSISSLNFFWLIISRMWFVLSSGMKTDARFLMNPWMISVRPVIDRSRMMTKTKSMLPRMSLTRSPDAEVRRGRRGVRRAAGRAPASCA